MPRKKYGNAMFSITHTHNKIRLLKMAFILVLSLNFNPAWSKTLVAQVDQIEIEMGDIISLRVVADFQNYSETPDFDSLKDQFEVLGTQRSSNMQIINGQYSSTTEWLAQLTPKKGGELRIPSFKVEDTRSAPITINVVQAKAYGTKNSVTFIEAELNKTQAFVQEEVLYTLRFFHLGRLVDGSIRPPLFDSALVKQLKNQQTYQKRINGQIYDVFEWRYAFYPQHSGELTIEPQDFTGRLQLEGQIRSIHDFSPQLTITVNPKPDSFPANQSWLPASKVVLQESWQAANQLQSDLHVGDNLTRTLKLQVAGQLASQLPSLSFENQTGLQIYPDQAKTHEEATTDGYRSEKLFKMAIIPTQVGPITLPEITLNWWNTTTNSLETLTLPAKTLDVLPSLNAAIPLAQAPVVSSLPSALPTDTVSDSPALRSLTNSSIAYPIIGLGVLSLIALAGWLLQWRTTQQLKRQLTQLNLSNLNETHQSASSGIENPNPALCAQPQTPDAFYRQLHQHLKTQPDWQNNPILLEQVTQLKTHLFKTPDNPLPKHWQNELCEQLKRLSPKTSAKNPKMAPQLQTLYPE